MLQTRVRDLGVFEVELQQLGQPLQMLQTSAGDLGAIAVLIERWRRHYNTVRPHGSLGYRPPAPEAIQPLHFVPATPPLREVAGLTVIKSLT